jgi:transposase
LSRNGGRCGYGLYRQIILLGHECATVAPSRVSTRSGDHLKADRRDAATQASLFS